MKQKKTISNMPRKNKRISSKTIKDEVRKSPEWKRFRWKIVDFYDNKDSLTNRPLLKGFNVHHLDMRAENYAKLILERFRPLNRKSHEVVHFLFTYYKKDPTILNNLKEILDLMVQFNND